MRKRILRLCLLLALFATPALAGTQLTIYTDMEPDLLNRYNKDLAAKFPDITIKWVRESGGPITARLLAEKDNPQADLILGLALSGVLSVDQVGGLEPYTPAGFDKIDPMMRDSRDNPTWYGMNVMVGSIAANTREMEGLKLPLPKVWADLIKPEYKDAIVMPNPLSSGTAYLHVTTWIQNWGEEKAWAYMEELHKNVKMYVHSGSKPGQMTAMGETPLGITVDAYIFPFSKKRAPVKSIIPEDGEGWEIIASAIVKGCRNPEAAKKIMDYGASRESSLIGLEFDYFPVRPELDDERLAEIRPRLLPMDHTRAAADRERVLTEWRRRFGGE